MATKKKVAPPVPDEGPEDPAPDFVMGMNANAQSLWEAKDRGGRRIGTAEDFRNIAIVSAATNSLLADAEEAGDARKLTPIVALRNAVVNAITALTGVEEG